VGSMQPVSPTTGCSKDRAEVLRHRSGDASSRARRAGDILNGTQARTSLCRHSNRRVALPIALASAVANGPIAGVNTRFQRVPDRYRLPDKSPEGEVRPRKFHAGLVSAAHARQAHGCGRLERQLTA
jgi:hypothetical protein